ncbi:dynamin family protein [Arthrobacter rhombi]|uniref:dynamin family protein n=1 Tax=Arthrobacter rhombi TaxID=71253 RepID=UPI003FD699CD
MTSLDSDGQTGPPALGLIQECRSALEAVSLPLDLPGAESVRNSVHDSVVQLDDYILPRYRSLDAPLLAVVGGSTGAGKSTLVNALVGYPVTRAGAIRPTTRQPILVHHPDEREWFDGNRILPGLPRITGTVEPDGQIPGAETATVPGKGESVGPVGGPSLLLLGHVTIPQGIALLDAPDIDSVSDTNRQLAGQLLAAADLWIFVTTANRYADAVPWRLLADAASRDITLAIVLDRVPPGVEDEVAADLRSMLDRQGLDTAGLFAVQESKLDGQGMLAAEAVAPIREWLADIAADSAGRAAIARKTLNGVVAALGSRTAAIAVSQQEQHDAARQLAGHVTESYAAAARRIDNATSEGTLLRGEVLARWQDFVGTGEFFRSLESGIGKVRDRIGAFFMGKPQPVSTVEEAIESGLHAVIVDEAAKAAEQSEAFWRSDPAARSLIGTVDYGSTSEGFSDRVAAEIRDWQNELLALIRSEGSGKRFTARMVSFGVNGVAVALMVVVFASTAGLTGLEVGIAGGTAVVGQKLLESIFGEDAVRRLAKTAREGLEQRVKGLLAEESSRFLTLLEDTPTTEEIARLKDLSKRLDQLAQTTPEATS